MPIKLRHIATVALVIPALLLSSCDGSNPTPEPRPIGQTVESLPTITVTPGEPPSEELPTITPVGVKPMPQESATALIGVTPRPTAIPFFTPLPVTPTTPPTATPELAVAAGGALVIDNVQFVDALRDPTRENGAIATLSVEFYGGLPPYTILDEDETVISGEPHGNFERGGIDLFWMHYPAETTCEAVLPRRVGIISADGQTVEFEFWIERVICSN